MQLGGVSLDGHLPSYLDRFIDRKARLPHRLVYPYSVIPGGVASPEEVAEAARRDPVVARHYAGFDPRRARVATLRQPRLAYVSYRVRDRVFFTKKPVSLFAGEQVITDGKTTIRARCGNKVEEAPQMAVSPEEPPEEILNTPRLEPEPERAVPVAPGLTAVAPDKETPLAAVTPPPGFAPLDMPTRGTGSVWLTPPVPGPGFLPPASSPAGPAPAPPPGTPGPDPGSPSPVVPPTPVVVPPPVTPPPPVAPPGGTPPGTPPATPPSPPSTPPPDTPPSTPPATPPGTPATPPVSPPVTPPSAPGSPSVNPPPAVPPSGPGAPPAQPPSGSDVPPPGPLPPPMLPPPPADPESPLSDPPPEIVIPPPDADPPPGVPEPPPIPEPSTYALVAAGLLALAGARRLKSRPR